MVSWTADGHVDANHAIDTVFLFRCSAWRILESIAVALLESAAPAGRERDFNPAMAGVPAPVSAITSE
jgi:hypothetical protein